jgi:hypothetical protein
MDFALWFFCDEKWLNHYFPELRGPLQSQLPENSLIKMTPWCFGGKQGSW